MPIGTQVMAFLWLIGVYAFFVSRCIIVTNICYFEIYKL
jgi:hypothetical protein